MEENNSSKSYLNIPSSSPEVKIRTMKSDIESFRDNGGECPQFIKVKVDGLSIEPQIQNSPTQAYPQNSISQSSTSSQNINGSQETEPSKKSSNSIGKVIIILILILILVAGGIYIYINFFSNKNQSALTGSVGQTVATTTQTTPTSSFNTQSNVSSIVMNQTTTPATTTILSSHNSLFKKLPDATATFSLPSLNSVTSASDLETYSQRVIGSLSSVSNNASFIEVVGKNNDGTYLNIADLFSNANFNIFDRNFLLTNFNPDVSFFVYRDSKGNIWPGYVLSSLQNNNQNLTQSVAKDIELSQSLSNIFLFGSWQMASSSFSNLIVSSNTARIVNFSGTTNSNFVYGWVRNYLIISSSKQGFLDAVNHL